MKKFFEKLKLKTVAIGLAIGLAVLWLIAKVSGLWSGNRGYSPSSRNVIEAMRERKRKELNDAREDAHSGNRFRDPSD